MANKLLVYKIILKPIWTYGIELWGCSKPSNTKVLQRFQSKMLRSITKAPWFVSNQTLHADLGISFINEVINKQDIKHRGRIVDTLTIEYTSSPSNPWRTENSNAIGQKI
jgi:hypothetical protein